MHKTSDERESYSEVEAGARVTTRDCHVSTGKRFADLTFNISVGCERTPDRNVHAFGSSTAEAMRISQESEG